MQTNFDVYNWETTIKSFPEEVRDENFKEMQDKIENDRERVYNAILVHAGITCKELSKKWGCSPNDISGRFTELKQMGRIIPISKKKIGSRFHTVWGI